MRKAFGLVVLALLLACSSTPRPPPPAEAPPTLEAILRARLDGDPTGACFAAAVVERDRVERAYVCANPDDEERIGPDTAFEIGSIAKTMTAALLAQHILDGKATLDDPLQAHLPEGVTVPAFEEQPILLRHLVTHSSGLPRLPPEFSPPDPSDPYAALDPGALLGTLSALQLERAPGASYEYSNYASMILSHVVGALGGTTFEEMVRTRLFEPLGMKHAYVVEPPPGVRPVQGHDPEGKPVPAWNFHPELAGVGGVRATLDDMIAYTEAQLGLRESPIGPALFLTQEPLRDGHPRLGMNWILSRTPRGETLGHEGATGGFSSFMAFDRRAERGVVVLSDTALWTLGGLSGFGMELLVRTE